MSATTRLPQGFRAAGVHCGIKRNPQKPDLSLIVSDAPAVAAGTYTTNRVFAAPVALDRARTPGDGFRAVVINSGNANACTGERGDRDAEQMARLAAESCAADAGKVLVLSTGVIGQYLPMEKIAAGIQQAAGRLAHDEDALVLAARGMMTTDSVHKLASRQFKTAGGSFQITGLAKGAAMIGPNMATMLAVILTDARLTPEAAQQALSAAVDRSFNCISVEGHMSTNDTVLLLAGGAAGGPALPTDKGTEFRQALDDVCQELARAIPADGEGATHLVTIDVRGLGTYQQARMIAKTVGESSLVKTAIAGGDPNWGRIVSAAGYAGVPFDPARIGLSVNGVALYRDGAPVAFDEAATSRSIREQRETHIEIAFGEGDAAARFWTTDLTAEYVRLNADYRT